jgi:hypothetical protein
MAYPTTLDSLTDPQPTDDMNTVSHSGLHQAVNTAIEALEAKVGVDDSAVTSSHEYKIGTLAGGTQNQVPKKNSSTDFDLGWAHESQYTVGTVSHGTITTGAATLTIDFSSVNSLLTITLSSGSLTSLTIATSNWVTGKTLCLRIINSTGNTVSIATGTHKTLGTAGPYSLATSKEAQISLVCWSNSAQTDVHLAYAQEA